MLSIGSMSPKEDCCRRVLGSVPDMSGIIILGGLLRVRDDLPWCYGNQLEIIEAPAG